MSHFTVLVIGDDVERQLQPFHEFECTGTDDAYVQSIDKTTEALSTYDKATVTRMRAPDGTLHDPYDEHGMYKDEFATERDRFHQRHLKVPEGWEQVEAPARDHVSAADYISEYYGWGILSPGQEHGSIHKYGWIEIDEAGSVIKCIDRTNPNAKWDWWVEGGRWTGFFKLKPNGYGQRGRPGLMTPPAKAGYADIVLKGAIDIPAMRDEAGNKAAEMWDKIYGAVGHLNDFIPWPDVRQRYEDINEAREFYHSQRAKVALAEAAQASTDEDNALGFWIDLEDYMLPREEHIQRARDRALNTFAYVLDGKWYQRGEMGWFGASTDQVSVDDWTKQMNQLIEALPDDTPLTLVDCHI